MSLDALNVIHLPKKHLIDPAHLQKCTDTHFLNAFFLDTCLRKIWIFFSPPPTTEMPVLTGTQAYAFLLKVISGLESEIAGETEISHQFKEAWEKYKQTHTQNALQKLFERLFEDSKEIRSQYLQNLGGVSYGSLTRKLLQKHTVNPQKEPILVIGAGKIAKAVAPWLTQHEIWLWNRKKESSINLHKELQLKTSSPVLIFENEEQAWSTAAHAVLCIPLDNKNDPQRRSLWRGKSLIHFGATHNECKNWEGLKNFHSLSALFDLQHEQEINRSAQLEQARIACDEKAALRTWIGLDSIPLTFIHGWEDLAYLCIN